MLGSQMLKVKLLKQTVVKMLKVKLLKQTVVKILKVKLLKQTGQGSCSLKG